MLELNELAFQNADLIVLLGEDAAGWSATDLARRLDRDRSNVRKSLLKLHELGLITSAASPELTEAGQEQRAAIQRARRGGDKRKPRGRWPLEKIIRNPANRVPQDLDVAALADTIHAAEDVLQDVLLTPPDANGVRMLLAGEHRWRAVQLLAEQDRLPAALAEGLPFRERQASAADQILIRIVENTARADLSPLEDARLLRDLQVQSNWSAREIAKKTGRSPADSDTGVRDVQVKIKVAKEATPEAIAEYERTGSWDALRDSVTQPKPRPAPEQELSQALAESGPAALGGAAQEPLAREWALDPPWTSETDLGMTDKHDRLSIRLFSHPDGRWFASLSTNLMTAGGGMGESFSVGGDNPARPTRLEALKAARVRALARHPDMPARFRDWLDQQLGPFYVNGVDRLNASNAGEARRALGWDKRHSNSGGSHSGEAKLKPSTEKLLASFKAQPEPAAAAVAPEPSDDRDIWDRDHNAIVADEATLQRVTDFTLGHTGAATPGYAHQLLAALGLEGPFGADDGGNVVSDVVGGLQPRPFATIDVDAEGPPQRARAIALLVAWALNRTFNEERAK